MESSRSRHVKRPLLNISIFFLCILPSAGQSSTLTNIDVVSMVKDRMSVALIKAKIRSSQASFDISNHAIGQLKRLGVPESVLVVMIERMNSQTNVPSPPVVSTNQPTAQSSPGGASYQSLSGLPPKRPGVPRIGIVTTTTTAPPEQDEAIRAQFYEVLYGNRETSTSEAILMREKLDRNIVSESILTKCDYLLFISLDSTIESALKKRGNFLQKGLKATAEALGAGTKLLNPVGMVTGLTYKSYQMADSLQASTTLLQTVAEATKKNDRNRSAKKPRANSPKLTDPIRK
jgi:hypothetical protein